MEKKCNICEEVFTSHSLYANHIRWKHTDQTLFKANLEVALKKRSDKRFGSKQTDIRKCEKCESTFEISYRKRIPANRFCSRSCANSGRVRTKEGIEKISTLLKNRWKDPSYRDKMVLAKENSSFNWRSKGEKDLFKELNIRFSNAFTYGGNFKLSDCVYLSLDCYSSSLKVIVEYDGIWHFKDIKGQLHLKQKKDNLLKEYCLQNNYQLIRVKEEVYLSSKETVLNTIQSHILTKDTLYVELY